MTKKHFEALAEIISEAQEYINDTDLYKISNRIADYCDTQSHKFDRDRFLKSCGFKDYQLINCQFCKGTQYRYNDVTEEMELCLHKEY